MKPYGDCIYCGGDVVERIEQVDYRSEGELFILEGVPTGVCRQCGEKYYKAEVVKRMETAIRNPVEPARSLTVPVIAVG